jgi:NADPH2:quinone reductase
MFVGSVMYQLFGLGLKDGWLKPRPYEVVPGGIGGVEEALKNLKMGKTSKYVFRISETQGLS